MIPKLKDPLGLNEYRPISLIGGVYKILSKALSNRLRMVVSNIVGVEQSAFIKGRYILNGVLVANETVDFMKRSKHKGLIFKVDFEKAFDSLDWDYLMEIMKCMGFGDKWCKWIYACLESASISILVNGSPATEYNMGGGVRQGEPLSPFLFIVAVEGLNVLAKSVVEKKLFKGMELGNDKVVVSHLKYADDTIFFGEWDHDNLKSLLNLLKCFELTSGLKINMSKRLERVRREFFWGISGMGKKYIGLNGEKIMLPYADGGLNIGSLKCKNLALLCKWWWRLHNEPSSLWAKIIISLYGPSGGLTQNRPLFNINFSSTWTSIVNARNYLSDVSIQFSNSFKMSVGDGSASSLWKDRWLTDECLQQNFKRLFELDANKDVKVCERVRWTNAGCVFSWDWCRELIGRATDDLETLQQMICGFNRDIRVAGTWYWSLASNGIFTTKKANVIISEKMLSEFRSQPVTLRNSLIPKRSKSSFGECERKKYGSYGT
ncbi:uncharacterized protein [Rutidosis leptorrhynchoides]|uniref:uncharacterized protein n=1 Tax=Rutidosis leptorrhynchoides TaxID=125765 RepID=UPI003A99AB47